MSGKNEVSVKKSIEMETYCPVFSRFFSQNRILEITKKGVFIFSDFMYDKVLSIFRY